MKEVNAFWNISGAKSATTAKPAKIHAQAIQRFIGRSLRAVLELPLEAIETAAFGGTNFAKLELMRSEEFKQDYLGPVSHIGHDAFELYCFYTYNVTQRYSITLNKLNKLEVVGSNPSP